MRACSIRTRRVVPMSQYPAVVPDLPKGRIVRRRSPGKVVRRPEQNQRPLGRTVRRRVDLLTQVSQGRREPGVAIVAQDLRLLAGNPVQEISPRTDRPGLQLTAVSHMGRRGAVPRRGMTDPTLFVGERRGATTLSCPPILR